MEAFILLVDKKWRFETFQKLFFYRIEASKRKMNSNWLRTIHLLYLQVFNYSLSKSFFSFWCHWNPVIYFFHLYRMCFQASYQNWSIRKELNWKIIRTNPSYPPSIIIPLVTSNLNFTFLKHIRTCHPATSLSHHAYLSPPLHNSIHREGEGESSPPPPRPPRPMQQQQQQQMSEWVRDASFLPPCPPGHLIFMNRHLLYTAATGGLDVQLQFCWATVTVTYYIVSFPRIGGRIS